MTNLHDVLESMRDQMDAIEKDNENKSAQMYEFFSLLKDCLEEANNTLRTHHLPTIELEDRM